MNIRIELLKKEDAVEILKFEEDNKEYFNSMIPPRHESYFDLDNLTSILEEIVEEQEQGLCYMYLIRDGDNNLVGRVNLFSIARGIFQKAEIGYRIGKKHTRRGYGTKAVELACKEAFEVHKLHKVEAGTSLKNMGSQIVLLKNGFEYVGRNRDVLKLNGQWIDGVLLERINENE